MGSLGIELGHEVVEAGLLLEGVHAGRTVLAATSFFLSRRVLRPASRSQMPHWQELFIWLAGSTEDATSYFQTPSDRVAEIGTQIVV